MKSVLENCGADREYKENLIKKGLFIPKTIQEYPDPLHPSHANKGLHELEKTIPRFKKEEREEYIKEPYKFYLDGLKAAEFGSWVVGELLKIVPNVKNIDNLDDKIAASLALIRIFFANYDFNYLKYDRDIEYYEFEESITGYFWQKMLKLCKIAFGKDGEQKFLDIIGGTPFFYKTIKYNLAKSDIKNKLKSYDGSPKEILEEINTRDKELYSEVLWIAGHFYKSSEDIIKESLSSKDFINVDNLAEKKKKGYQDFWDAYKILLSKDFMLAEEFNDSYRAVEVLMRLNEKIGFIVRGKTPQNNGYFYNDSLITLFSIIRETYEKDSGIVKKEKLDFVRNVFKKVDEMKVIGITPGIKYFLMEFEKHQFFSDNINKLYQTEMERWYK